MAETAPPSKPMSELVRYEDFKRHLGQGIRNNLYFLTITFKSGNLIKRINDKFKTSNTAQDNSKESNAVNDIKVITPFCQEVEIPTFKIEPGEEVFRNFQLPKTSAPGRTSKMILWNDAYDTTYDFWAYLISTTNNTATSTYADDIMFDAEVEVYDMNSFLYKKYNFIDCYAMSIPEKKYSDNVLSIEDLRFTVDFIYRDFKKSVYPSRINNFFSESSVAARLFASEGTKMLNKFISGVAEKLSGRELFKNIDYIDILKTAADEAFYVLGDDILSAFQTIPNAESRNETTQNEKIKILNDKIDSYASNDNNFEIEKDRIKKITIT